MRAWSGERKKNTYMPAVYNLLKQKLAILTYQTIFYSNLDFIQLILNILLNNISNLAKNKSIMILIWCWFHVFDQNIK